MTVQTLRGDVVFFVLESKTITILLSLHSWRVSFANMKGTIFSLINNFLDRKELFYHL